MKKSILAITTAAAIAGSTVIPVQAADRVVPVGQKTAAGYKVTVIQGNNLDELKEKLNERLDGLGGSIGNIYWQVCPPDIILPDGNTPNQPGTDGEQPGVDAPDNNQPDTDQPGTDGPGPDVPGTDVPDHNTPDTDQPGQDMPDNETPDTDQPGSDTEAPDNGTNQPDDMNKPGGDTNKPDDNNKPGPDSHDRTFAQQVVDLVNAERVKAGLATLTVDQNIEAAALVRAKETEVSFSHTRPNGTSFSTALTEQGVSFKGSGENIAWGQRTPQEVMKGWMNSDGHRANILNPRFTKIGVGYYQNAAGRNYWTQLFTY